ncbi:hypothetical protein N7451_012905 [Penicillium sp. IBT 35674x]|nr:hypothetical protein N7451_012905 [Penicillium sp. IBT 35674x]
MPRMSSLFLTRTLDNRPQTTPASNVGLAGPFTEFPHYTCADVSVTASALLKWWFKN